MAAFVFNKIRPRHNALYTAVFVKAPYRRLLHEDALLDGFVRNRSRQPEQLESLHEWHVLNRVQPSLQHLVSQDPSNVYLSPIVPLVISSLFLFVLIFLHDIRNQRFTVD